MVSDFKTFSICPHNLINAFFQIDMLVFPEYGLNGKTNSDAIPINKANISSHEVSLLFNFFFGQDIQN